MVYTTGGVIVADTLEELHAFARKTGVFNYVNNKKGPFYQLDKMNKSTVVAHGAKFVSVFQAERIAKAAIKKEEQWYKTATDEEIYEKVKKYAPYKRDEEVHYQGQMCTQEEMFTITTEMFKDLRDGYPTSGYGLPKKLPPFPRQDPPTYEETLKQLADDILQGERFLTEMPENEHGPIKERLESLKLAHLSVEVLINEKALAAKEKNLVAQEVLLLDTLAALELERMDQKSKDALQAEVKEIEKTIADINDSMTALRNLIADGKNTLAAKAPAPPKPQETTPTS